MLNKILCPIHREGWPFIAIFAIISMITYGLSTPLGLIAWTLTGWCTYFFRDPARVTPTREGLVISPADGLVQTIVQVVPPVELDLGSEEMTRISIFMNVFDVHVNRIPIDGIILKTHYYPGKFLNASLDKASEDNERQGVSLVLPDNRKIGVIQIAGLIGRRIVCDVKAGQTMQAGERFGMIRFGSRVDVYLPKGIASLVIPGQKAVAGETVLADLTSTESSRVGRLA